MAGRKTVDLIPIKVFKSHGIVFSTKRRGRQLPPRDYEWASDQTDTRAFAAAEKVCVPHVLKNRIKRELDRCAELDRLGGELPFASEYWVLLLLIALDNLSSRPGLASAISAARKLPAPIAERYLGLLAQEGLITVQAMRRTQATGYILTQNAWEKLRSLFLPGAAND